MIKWATILILQLVQIHQLKEVTYTSNTRARTIEITTSLPCNRLALVLRYKAPNTTIRQWVTGLSIIRTTTTIKIITQTSSSLDQLNINTGSIKVIHSDTQIWKQSTMKATAMVIKVMLIALSIYKMKMQSTSWVMLLQQLASTTVACHLRTNN